MTASSNNLHLEALWKRVAEKGDFPALAQSVRSISNALKQEDPSALVNIILSDFTLTQRVIRLANSARYSALGGKITTVSRALLVLGSEGIANVVIGLKLLDAFAGSTQEDRNACEELSRAKLASNVARSFTRTRGVREGEEAVVVTLLQHLGRLLVVCYLHDEWQTIQRRAGENRERQNAACAEVLGGFDFNELAQQAARQWGLPSQLSDAMQPFDAEELDGAASHTQWLRAVAGFSAEASAKLDPNRPAPQHIEEIAERYCDVLAVDTPTLVSACAEVASAEKQERRRRDADAALSRRIQGKPFDAKRRLIAALAELRAIRETAPLSALLNVALESLLGAMGFDRTIAFLRQGSNKLMQARMGFGAGVEELLPMLRFEEAFAPDVFHLAMTNSKGIVIDNARDARLLSRIPAWHRQAMPTTRSFLLLPVRCGEITVALVYADWTNNTGMQSISQEELHLINELGEELTKAVVRATQVRLEPSASAHEARD